MQVKSYLRPLTEAELYRALERERAPVLFVAGATDILVQARNGEPFRDRAAIDLTALPMLREIREDEDYIYIGGTATHAEVAASQFVTAYAPVLAAAAAEIGAVQLRNRATIGGNIVNASPAGDTQSPLAVLNAAVLLDCMGELRELPYIDVISGSGKTALREREFLRAVRIPKLPNRFRWRFEKVGRRNAMSISRLTVSVVADVSNERKLNELRVGIGAAFQRPMRFLELEQSALGKPLSDGTVEQIAGAFSDTLPQIAGRRASTDYKQPVCRMILARLLREMRDER
jgi:CO/xanthine dehydrogenase FAD-binding subunit